MMPFRKPGLKRPIPVEKATYKTKALGYLDLGLSGFRAA